MTGTRRSRQPIPRRCHSIPAQDPNRWIEAKATDARGKFTTTQYTVDAKVGAVENATHGANGRTVNSWDKNDGDSLSQSQSPTGALVKATYPTSGLKYLPDTVTDSMGSVSTITYDGPGNLQSNADALNNTAAIKYNADGTVDFAVDPMNVTSPSINLQDRTKATQYGYNALHQLTSVTPPSGNSLGVRNLTYDGFGRLKTVTTPANNVTTTYDYDALDRLRSETHSNGAASISYDYDANGNLFHRIDGSGTTTYIHDAANRLSSKAIPGGPTLTYGYDAVGNLTSVGGDGRGTTTYQYDKVNRLEQMTESGSGRINVFAYNADGQRTNTWYAASYTGGGGVRYDVAGNVVAPTGFAAHIYSELNNANQLKRIKTTRASSDVDANRVADISYSYDFPSPNPCPNPPAGIVHTGLRQSSTDNITGKVTNYCYDGAGRLIKAMTNNGGPTHEWTYDADGNRLSGRRALIPPTTPPTK